MIYKFIRSLLSIYWKNFHPNTLGVRTLVINNNKILLVKHSYGNKYYLPGGGVKKFESFENAAKREVLEETGYKITKVKLFGVFQNTNEGKQDTDVVFITNKFSLKTEKISWEIKEARWFDINKLPKYMNEGSQKRINEYRLKIYPTFGKW